MVDRRLNPLKEEFWLVVDGNDVLTVGTVELGADLGGTGPFR